MRRTCQQILLIMLLIFSGLSLQAQSFFVEIQANGLFPADSNFKSSYQSTVFMPALKGGFKFTENIYVFAGFGFFNLKGETPILKIKTESKQTTLSLGLGYEGHFSDAFSYQLELGGSLLSYEEKAFEIKSLDGSKLAPYFGVGLSYGFSKNIYAALHAFYLQASDTYEDVAFKLGGFNTSLGLGLRF